MTKADLTPGIVAGRLDSAALAAGFADLHPALSAHEARVAADRCYFCHDAPCTIACPTTIDIPQFIREISTGATLAAARTIFDQNILGGMCARVCPTETLCEEACVREAAEGEPVQIGRLQRFATDTQMATGRQPYTRAAATGKRIGVVGAGPAGLAGGLNEFGIAAYKSVDDFAAHEIDWLLSIGGIRLETGKRLGDGLTLDQLQSNFDAVFLGLGLGGVNALRAEGEDMAGVSDAVDFIADLRQAGDLTQLPIGRNVVVIGGGMTAIDAGVQSKLLGAETVTIVYRRGQEAMSASPWEQELAASRGVTIRHWAKPLRVTGNGAAREVEFEYTRAGASGLEGTGETFRLPADQVFKAIGQTLDGAPDGLALEGGKIQTDAEGRTSLPGIWAGGDCATGGDDLTVTAVAEGRDAADSIHAALSN
jgi:glutamate synthase (NADPH/NADH) small chain